LGSTWKVPFLNEKRKGAMNAAELREPNGPELEHYLDAAEGHLRIATLAPELRGGGAAVSLLVERGVTVSIGHSDATYAETVEAIKLGASHTTHHFNGMRPWNHREPEVSGAGLMLPQLTTEIIADGFNVHPSIVKFLFDTKGEHNVCVITDSVSCAGMPDGEYGNQRVIGA
jgi:N-acetylglucosamine-6-phosphate deacetylase